MNTLTRLILGAIGGVVATGPMTIAMILWHRRLPLAERYPLPPREITMKLAHEAGVDHELGASARSAATLISHFGYGGAAGALYAGVINARRQPAARGLLFGLFVWLVSYLGWLPAAQILTPATAHPARRNALMIGAHLVWGLTLGAFVALLSEEAETIEPQPFSSSGSPHRDAR